MLTLIAVVVLAAVGYYLHTARGGRELYAIGSDPDAAVLYGLPVSRRVARSPSSSAARSPGWPACCTPPATARSAPSAGSGIELQAVGAAVIGGVAIFGGSGTVWGAAIGAFLLVTINRALPILGIPDFWQRAVVGALILGAIVLDRVLAAAPGTQARRSEGPVMSAPTVTRPSRRPAPTRPTRAPWWRRVLLTREFAVIALLVARLRVYSIGNVANFDGPLTLYYLLLDIAPILLIALPMTLIIITGEIDLSVASVVGLTSVLVGILHHDAGLSIPVAAAARPR